MGIVLAFITRFPGVLLSMSPLVDGAKTKRFGGGTGFVKQRSINQQAAARPIAGPGR
jgi:hypothetical protein